MYAVVDGLTRSGLTFSETFFWTGFLIPFFEVTLNLPFQDINSEAIEAGMRMTPWKYWNSPGGNGRT